MRAILLRFVLFLFSMSALAFAHAQTPDRAIPVWRDKGWAVYLYRTADDAFDRCSTVIQYKSGRILSFSVGTSSELIMRVGQAGGPLGQPNQRMQAYIQIDKLEPRALAAMVETGTRGFAVHNFHQDYSIFRNLRRGYVLALSGDLGEEKLSLKGSADALRQMANCVPRPFSPSHSVRTMDKLIVRATVSKDMSGSGAGEAEFFRNMGKLRQELLGPGTEEAAPDEAPSDAALDSTP